MENYFNRLSGKNQVELQNVDIEGSEEKLFLQQIYKILLNYFIVSREYRIFGTY